MAMEPSAPPVLARTVCRSSRVGDAALPSWQACCLCSALLIEVDEAKARQKQGFLLNVRPCLVTTTLMCPLLPPLTFVAPRLLAPLQWLP